MIHILNIEIIQVLGLMICKSMYGVNRAFALISRATPIVGAEDVYYIHKP